MSTVYQNLMSIIREEQVVFLETTLQKMTKGHKISKKILDSKSVPEEVLEKGYPIIIEEEICTRIIEPFYNKERLIVFGGGHIAQPLVDFASKTGFQVIVVDDRPTFANTMRFKEAHEVICCSFEDFTNHLLITPFDYVVIVTRGHRHDKVCIEQLLQGIEPFYTGMIGSKRRVKALTELLIEEGASCERINRIHTPIGLAIGAVTPSEIAVSILAEIIQHKRRTHHNNQVSNHSDVDYFVLEELEKDSSPKSIVTIIDAKGSVPRRQGSKMLVYPDGRIVGSIGGGCSEANIITYAREIIGTTQYQIRTIDMTGELAEEEGMVCGGILTVLIEDDVRREDYV